MNNNEPIWRMTQGGLSAAAWNNTVRASSGQSVERLSVRLERRFKDKEGAWQSSSSYTLSELYQLSHFVGRVIDRAIAEARENQTGGEVA